jgi:uncharacterized protein HemX
MQLIAQAAQQAALPTEAYGALQNLAIQFGFPAVLLILTLGAVGYALWSIGGKIMNVTIETMGKISLSNEKNADATEKIAQLIDVMTKQNDIIDKRLSNIESLTKRQIHFVRKCVLALKELVPKEKQHIKDSLNEILAEIKE